MKKRISTFQLVLIGLFTLGALIGVFVFASYSGKSSADTIGPVTIWGTLPSSAMGATLALVTQTNQNLKAVSYIEKSPLTIEAELASAIATGVGPDLILASQENLNSLKKFIAPIPFATLPATTFTTTFVQGASVFAAPSGYYGVPFLVDPLVLFYNRSILASSGIAKPPSTWEALTGLVPSVATLTPTRQIMRSLIALGAYDNVRNARGILSTLFFQTGVPVSATSRGGAYLSADLGLRSQGGAPAGQAVVSFYTQFADPSKVSYTWNATLPDSQRAFLSGDLALYLGYVSEARYLAAANPNLSFGVATLPQPATAQTKSAYGLVYAFMIPRGAKNSSGAYQVSATLASSEAELATASATGLTPANVNVLVAPANDPVASVAYAEALYTKGWLSPRASDTDSVFSAMIRDVTTGRSTLQVALVSAEQALSQLLQR